MLSPQDGRITGSARQENPVAQVASRMSATGAGACHIERISRLARLEAILPQWTALADTALVPAVMQEPAWVLSCVRNMGLLGLETLALWSDVDSASNERELFGMVTVKPANWQWGLPAGPFNSAINQHVFDGTPLLHRHHAVQALASLFRQVHSPFLFESVPDLEPFRSVLDTSIEASGRKVEWYDNFERGVYTCDRSAGEYLLDTHSRGRRNKFRRWRKQLRGEGTLDTETLAQGEELDCWMAEFLALEAKGWKGRSGTAVACSPVDTAFFRDALTMIHAQGRLLFWRLARGGKSVAMLFGMRHRRHVSLGKITYDEDHAHYTPGALMLLDVMDWAYQSGDIDFIDACGRPGNDMIDALWKERLNVSDCLVSAPDCSPTVFGAQCKAESLRRVLRQTAKSLYHNIKAVSRKSGSVKCV